MVGQHSEFINEGYTRVHSIDEVEKLRTAIRRHRDEKGDNRCHLDDDLLYEVLPEGKPSGKRKLPPNLLENCKKFFECRQNVEFTSVEELYSGWSKDRPYLSNGELKLVIEFLRAALDKMSNAGSNDFELPNTDENWELIQAAGSPWGEEGVTMVRPVSETISTSDEFICSYLIEKLERVV